MVEDDEPRSFKSFEQTISPNGSFSLLYSLKDYFENSDYKKFLFLKSPKDALTLKSIQI